MSDLKLCPFCGGKAKIIKQSIPMSTLNGIPYDSMVYCSGCEITQSGWAPENQVIEEWNTRL